jgi:amino acid permease
MPSIYESMENPKMYDRVVDVTWLILGAVYLGMAALGYLMYGDETQDQVWQ